MFDPVNLLLPGAVYATVLLAALAAWSWIFSSPGIANLLVARLEGPPPAPRAASPDARALIVVLGSGNLAAADGSGPPRLDAHGWERLREGIRLRGETGGTLLLTGGPGGERESIAALMRAVALESGVPPAAVMTAPRSRNTWEDLSQSAPLIRTHRGPAWLVTSAIHMPRALAVAARLGLRLEPRPCDFRQIAAPTWRAWLPDDGGPRLWSLALHELAGLRYYRWRGWADS
ncbi:MAG TPA: YdcF family protein [Usitatibacter sp.]|nr:YdcF family protein [Usitatibacter sp.]